MEVCGVVSAHIFPPLFYPKAERWMHFLRGSLPIYFLTPTNPHPTKKKTKRNKRQYYILFLQAFYFIFQWNGNRDLFPQFFRIKPPHGGPDKAIFLHWKNMNSAIARLWSRRILFFFHWFYFSPLQFYTVSLF